MTKILNEWLMDFGGANLPALPVEKIAADSRELDANTWWIARAGISSHALDYYDENIECAGIIYEPPYQNPPQNAFALPSLTTDYGNIAADFFDFPSKKLRLIGVTGTDGKSSLAYFLAQATNGAMIGTIGNGKIAALTASNNTTPDAFSNQKLLAEFVKDGIQTVAMEVSSHALDQNRVQGLCFDTVVFSNLSRDHFDYHGNQENYFQAKAKLFQRPSRFAVINIDDEFGRRLLAENLVQSAEICTISTRAKERLDIAHHHIAAKNILQNSSGISFELAYFAANTEAIETVEINSALWGRFNVDNLCNAAACLLAGGLKLSEVAEKLRQIRGATGRAEIFPFSQNRRAIVDYAHTPKALESVISGIRDHISGKLTVVFGCGGDRDRGKRPLMAQVAEKLADRIIITNDNPRSEEPEQIIVEIKQGLENPQDAVVIFDRKTAIETGLLSLKEGDSLLVAGKGHEDYQIIAGKKIHFSDQEVIREFIATALV